MRRELQSCKVVKSETQLELEVTMAYLVVRLLCWCCYYSLIKWSIQLPLLVNARSHKKVVIIIYVFISYDLINVVVMVGMASVNGFVAPNKTHVNKQ